MAFTAKDVMELRNRTGAGMMDCKAAMEEANGDLEKAGVILREKGIAAAGKKSGRIAAEGIVESYIHLNGKIGVLLEINCETDFVAKGEKFKQLAHDIAMQIAASNPTYVNEEDVPADEVEKEKEILRVQALNEGKPAAVVEKMIEGRIKKFYKDIVLLDQEYVKDGDKTIGQLITESIAQIGEKITVRRFVRYEMGEGLTKKSENLADEIAKQINK